MTRVPTLSRRALLRGMGGAALALPWLEVMAAEPGGAPCRFLPCFMGMSRGGEFYQGDLALTVQGYGRDFQLPPEMAALEAVREHLMVVSGMEIPAAGPLTGTPVAGRSGDIEAFHYHNNPLFAGMAQTGAERDDTVTGPSADQRVADVLGGSTRIRDLPLRAQVLPYTYDSPPNHRRMSYRDNGGEITPIDPFVSPRQVWDLLTTGVVPPTASQAADRAAELGRRRTVLDLVDRRMSGLMSRLGSHDRQRMERHFDEVRDMERRLEMPAVEPTSSCIEPIVGADPDILDSGWSGETERALAFHRLIQFAFACDLTRVGSLMYTFMQPFVTTGPMGSRGGQMHELIHNGDMEADVLPCIGWHMELFADLVGRLADTPEGDGSVLDHCALTLMVEGGFEEYPWEAPAVGGTSHSTKDMVWLAAGGAGGLERGTHLAAPEGAKHPGNLMVSLMQSVGVETDRLGEVVGAMPGVRRP